MVCASYSLVKLRDVTCRLKEFAGCKTSHLVRIQHFSEKIVMTRISFFGALWRWRRCGSSLVWFLKWQRANTSQLFPLDTAANALILTEEIEVVSMLKLFLQITAFALTLVGCATQPRAVTTAGNIHWQPELVSSLSEVAGPLDLVLLADNQFRQPDGLPTFIHTRLPGTVNQSARRPVAVEAFGEDLFSALLGHIQQFTQQHRPLVVHLGDAMDYSCLGEWQRFVRAMDRHQQPWLLVPGNHDGFWSGLTHAGSEDKFEAKAKWWTSEYGRDRTVWQMQCGAHQSESQVLSKPSFIKKYVERFYPLASIDGRFRMSKPWSRGDLATEGQLFNDHCATTSSDCVPWRSWMAQRLRVSDAPIDLILLDTSRYENRPGFLFSSAGEHAGLGPEQRAQAEDWLRKAEADGRRVLLLGHHPIQDFSPAERDWLSRIAAQDGVIAYFSAHTHKGFQKVHRSNALEVNIGSTVDGPIEFWGVRWPRKEEFRGFRVRPNGSMIFSGTSKSCEELIEQVGGWKYLQQPSPKKSAGGYTEQLANLSEESCLLVRIGEHRARQICTDAKRAFFVLYRKCHRLGPERALECEQGSKSKARYVAQKLSREMSKLRDNSSISTSPLRACIALQRTNPSR